MIDNNTLPETGHDEETPMSAIDKLAAGSPDPAVHTDEPSDDIKDESFEPETSTESDLELTNSEIRQDVSIVIESIDFPTPFFHTSNPDGTRNAVMFSELKQYIDSLQ